MNTNVCVFTGRLIKTALLNELPNGSYICNFCIAVDESLKDNAKWTNFINCSIYGKYAESLVKYLKKGVEVTVTCRLHQNRWKKEDKNHNSYVFYVDNLMLQRTPKAERQVEEEIEKEFKISEETDAEIEPLY